MNPPLTTLERPAVASAASEAVTAPAESTTPEPPASLESAVPAKPKVRDGFLDTVRTIALGRVIVWHAFGIPWISWLVATMPMMFFIAGSLLASTLDRKPIGVMYRSRLKRLLVPYWFFSACVLAFLAMVHLANPTAATVIRLDQILPWVFPFTDPTCLLYTSPSPRDA